MYIYIYIYLNSNMRACVYVQEVSEAKEMKAKKKTFRVRGASRSENFVVLTRRLLLFSKTTTPPPPPSLLLQLQGDAQHFHNSIISFMKVFPSTIAISPRLIWSSF